MISNLHIQGQEGEQPKQLAAISPSNMQIEDEMQMEHQKIWRKKLQKHFPHVSLTLSNGVDYQQIFKEVSDVEYQGLSVYNKKLFPLVKDGDVKALTGKLQLENLMVCDVHGRSLLSWSEDNQSLLDYFYQLANAKYRIKPTLNFQENTNCYENLLHFSIFFNQSIEVCKQIIEEINAINPAVLSTHSIMNHGLIDACKNGRHDVVKLLLENGANVNYNRYSDGHARKLYSWASDRETPLHVAVSNDWVEVVKVLLSKGANASVPFSTFRPRTRDSMFLTALEIAKEKKSKDIVLILEVCKYVEKCDEFGVLSFFSKKSVFKKMAAVALLQVLIGEAAPSSLQAYKETLSQGDLGLFYKRFVQLYGEPVEENNEGYTYH